MSEIPKIIWEDEDTLVLDKPAGLEVAELLEILIQKYPGAALVHRLDRDTTGLIIVAKNPTSLAYLQAQFKERKVIKHYRAIAQGHLKKEAGTIDLVIGRDKNDPRKRRAGRQATGNLREAKTVYQVLKLFPGYTYLEAAPLTGRTHQIRAHLAALGHPLAGDTLYGAKPDNIPSLSRQALHAYYLKLELPDGKTHEFTAPLPADFQAALDYLEVV